MTSKPGSQAKDLYAQRTKALTSTVQKVRGWVGSDPSRTTDLADALVELTAHRLLGHAWTAAAADAQEAVKLSAQLLTANGPLGPYTDIEDAVRYVTAVVQLAVVQVGLGLPDAAGRTIESLADLKEQLGADAVAAGLSARTAIWALVCSARAHLAAGEVGVANAYADAAAARLAESGLLHDAESAYLVIDTDRVLADARWAAADAVASLGYLVAARSRYDAVVAGRLGEPARLSEGLRDRLAEPLVGLYGNLADRLDARGERDVGLAVRRELVATLRRLAERAPESRAHLAVAMAALAADLTVAGRGVEAEPLSAEAAQLDAEMVVRHGVPLGRPVEWSALEGASAYAATTSGSHGRAARESELVGAARIWLDSARAEAERTEAALRVEAESAAQRRAAAAAAARAAESQREAREAEEAAERARREAEERAAAEEAERQERKRRRAERIAEHRRLAEAEEAERQPTDPAEQERLELERLQAELDALEQPDPQEAARVEAARLEAERVEAERLEEARLEEARLEAARVEVARVEVARVEAERAQAERVEAERVEAERLEAERLEAERLEAERVEAERVEAERVEAERVETERVETERVETERAQAAEDELALAQRAWSEARSTGDRRAARAANERVVELLRARTQDDLPRYGPALIAALEELSRARLRSGDLFGSRGPAREAKTLAKSLGT